VGIQQYLSEKWLRAGEEDVEGSAREETAVKPKQIATEEKEWETVKMDKAT
jgi:hypothetical protein